MTEQRGMEEQWRRSIGSVQTYLGQCTQTLEGTISQLQTSDMDASVREGLSLQARALSDDIYGLSQAVAVVWGLPPGPRRMVDCRMTHNEESIVESAAVKCPSGHHFCKKHRLSRCIHDGLDLP